VNALCVGLKSSASLVNLRHITRQVSWYTPEYKYKLSNSVFILFRMDCIEFLVQNVTFSFVCLNNLVTKVVSFPV
jgi:hypothetical protein